MPRFLSPLIQHPVHCSEKLDVEDHYVAWSQTHDTPQHQFGADGPFSFCSYPFLLNPRAKSKLLHTEARFLMTQARMGGPLGCCCLYAWCLLRAEPCEDRHASGFCWTFCPDSRMPL